MEKKLRLRFLLITWGLLLLLFVTLCAGVWVYYQSWSNDSAMALQRIIMQFDTAETASELFEPTLGTAAIRATEDGTVTELRLGRLALSEETANKIAEAVKESPADHMDTVTVDGMEFRYLLRITATGERQIAITENGGGALWQKLPGYIIVFIVLATVLSFAVSMMLSHIMTKPIADAWQKQNDFVSDATHELKTPLTVIGTNTDAVLSNPEATVSSQSKWLDSISGETKRMAGLVADLLFIAKADAGEIKLGLRPLRISDEMEGLCMEWESEFFERGQIFEYAVTENMVYSGDWAKIRRMTEVLLDNAMRYTPQGGSVHLVMNRTGKMQLQIIVSNTGETLTVEQQKKIFDRFYRVDASRARESGGYGLGLCIASAIAQLHNGGMCVSSEGGMNVFTAILGDAETSMSK
ncbi:MAG: ATP-binding protein [Oscillospiraceae bacterium]|nr:ATP-binding protein [Oscillospiraceae bacterium]